MIAGHFGLAAAVKSRVPEAPTWALMLATVWLDVLFTPLFAAGVEGTAPFNGGDGTGYGRAVIHADWTHSIVGALLLSALFGLFFAPRQGRKVGAVLGAVVFSHWLLDLPLHHQDMPILPGNAGHLPLLGFGLWSVPAAAAALELALLAGGAWLYWQRARELAGPDAALLRHADRAALAIALSGVVTLALSVAGM